MTKITSLLAVAIAALGIQSASAALNYWVNWTGAPASYTNTMTGPFGSLNYATLATGTLYDPNTSQTINVTYTGEVYSESEFNDPSGTDWFDFPAYLSSSVTTTPPAGNFIALTGYSGLTNTLTFSAPVSNLLLAIGSLGNSADLGQLNFDRPAVVVSYGQGLYGNGPLYMTNTTSVAGFEGNGMVQFTGTFSSVSWTVPFAEQYMVYNIGITDQAVAGVPEPGTWAAAALLAGGAAFTRWRKRAKVS